MYLTAIHITLCLVCDYLNGSLIYVLQWGHKVFEDTFYDRNIKFTTSVLIIQKIIGKWLNGRNLQSQIRWELILEFVEKCSNFIVQYTTGWVMCYILIFRVFLKKNELRYYRLYPVCQCNLSWTSYLHAILGIISRGVSCLATDSLCGVWGRRWSTCLLHDSLLFGSQFKMRVGM